MICTCILINNCFITHLYWWAYTSSMNTCKSKLFTDDFFSFNLIIKHHSHRQSMSFSMFDLHFHFLCACASVSTHEECPFIIIRRERGNTSRASIWTVHHHLSGPFICDLSKQNNYSYCILKVSSFFYNLPQDKNSEIICKQNYDMKWFLIVYPISQMPFMSHSLHSLH